MKLVVSFKYDSVLYQYTIDEHDIDYSHYEYLWDFWVGQNKNELSNKCNLSDTKEKIFEISGEKKFIDGKEIISSDDITICVYDNIYDDLCQDVIDCNIEVLYA